MNNANWDLSVFYESFSDPALRKDIEKIAAFSKKADEILASGKADFEIVTDGLNASIDLNNTLMNAYGFIELSLSTDANNMEALKYLDEMSNLMVDVQVASGKFVRYIGSIENLDEIIEKSDFLKTHAFYLQEAAESAKHMLPEEMEKWVLRLSLDGADAFAKLRDRLMGNHTVELNGESLPLPAVRGMAYDPDPAVRKAAYEAE
ncbi:MAG: hypothetical protein IJN21_09375, partial [Clostridia bacterium]|nr:hypothetical protein [Clostridia bacterium]